MLVWTVPTVCDPSWSQDGSSVTNLSVTISTMLVVVCGGGGVGRSTRPDTEVQQHADTHRDIVINTPNTSPAATLRLELETKVKQRFRKVSIVSYSRPSLMIIASASQFHFYLQWGERPFSIVS